MLAKEYLGHVVFSKIIHWPYSISVEAVEAISVKWGLVSALKVGLSGFSNYQNVVSTLCLNVAYLTDIWDYH